MKSLKPTIHAVVSTLLLLATSLAFGPAIANPKFPANGFSKLYAVGDRVQIGDTRGDVIES
jgi:hypothetical protein